MPLLAKDVVELAFRIPEEIRFCGGGKGILRRAYAGRVPNEILNRSKMGFGVPLGKWFRGPLKQRLRESLLEGGLAQSGVFRHEYLEQLVNDHQSGLREYSAPLWALVMFQATLAGDDVSVT